MPLYAYQAVDKSGALQAGKVEAEHELIAVANLRKLGYTVFDLEEEKESSFKKLLTARRKVKLADVLFFTRQLAAMLAAGIPLTRCLHTLSRQSENSTLAGIAGEVARNVEGGMSLSEALKSHRAVFSQLYIDMIKAGEIGGSIEEILTRLADQLERDKRLRDNIRSATFYPAVVLSFAFLVVLVMLLLVVPVFAGFFPPGMKLPLPTKIVFAMSGSIRKYGLFYLLAFLGWGAALRVFIAGESGRRFWDRIKFRLPVAGPLIKKTIIARFSRTLSTLLAGGIPVLQALEAAGPASGSRQVAEVIRSAAEGIHEGQSIAVPLEKSGFFPPMLIDMVRVGEETGRLSALLARVADFYEEEVATMTKGLTSMLEPVLLIGVGIVTGGIVVSIYLPIFSAVTTLGR
ncbi:MAG: type II secretion system F family protein [Firmicutes bacterium]|nr:type II secretion system F family protein [Bacillota bacterium]